MKKTVLIIALAVFAAAPMFAQSPGISLQATEMPKAGGPQLTLTSDVIDYGNIKKGANGEREFVFTNTGTEPLIISNAQGSCGCTVPTWPKEPIMPGQKSAIKVKYDTNRVGNFTKYVTLTTNAAGQESLRLTIKGNVEQESDPVPAKDGGMLNGGGH
jgi:hypothetical protein